MQPKEIKQEPEEPPCEVYVADDPPPPIKTEFDGTEPLGENPDSVEKEENVFTYSATNDPNEFSKTDESMASEDHFEDEQVHRENIFLQVYIFLYSRQMYFLYLLTASDATLQN